MGGYFGAACKHDVVADVFFGTDYHSHLGTRRAGMAVYDSDIGLQREIHNIENSPFRTKFGDVFEEMHGFSAIGCISDIDPQPLLIRSRLGTGAVCFTGNINNAKELIDRYLNEGGGHFNAMTGGKVNNTELVAALINQKDTFVEGIHFAQQVIDGSVTLLILLNDGSILDARDRFGRLPIHIGKKEDGYCLSFESYVCEKLGYECYKELGPGEIVSVTSDGVTQLSAPGKKKKVCSFLWSYYGFPASSYEGVNVEIMRYRNGEIMAQSDLEAENAKDVDYVGGVPDSGTPHAIGYANRSRIPFARAFIKYTPSWSRSFTPARQSDRMKIATMKQIPVHELIRNKSLLFVDDSIVRGTQLKGTVDFLYDHGAKAVHMRSACPPIMYPCKYLSFSRSNDEMDLIARRVVYELEGEEGVKHLDEYRDSHTERGKKLRQTICDKFHFASLEFQSLEGLIDSIGLPAEDLCTYCWNGKE